MEEKRYGRHLNAGLKPGLEPRTVEVAGRTMFYESSGDGAPLLLLHGIPGSQRHMRKMVDALAPNFQVITPDLPGFGASQEIPEPGVSTFASQVIGLADALGLERFALAGHSLGAAVALQVAADIPDRVHHLALLAPVGLKRHMSLRRSNIPFKDLAEKLDSPGAADALREVGANFARIGFRRFDQRELVQCIRFMASMNFEALGPTVDRVKAPTLIVRAEDDRSVEQELYEELEAKLPAGPRVVFPEGGHFVQNTLAIEMADAFTKWLLN